jgi:hypothetical protein
MNLALHLKQVTLGMKFSCIDRIRNQSSKARRWVMLSLPPMRIDWRPVNPSPGPAFA